MKKISSFIFALFLCAVNINTLKAMDANQTSQEVSSENLDEFLKRYETETAQKLRELELQEQQLKEQYGENPMISEMMKKTRESLNNNLINMKKHCEELKKMDNDTKKTIDDLKKK